MLFKEIVDARTDARTDAGHWRITKAHLSTSCSGELKSKHNNPGQSRDTIPGPLAPLFDA